MSNAGVAHHHRGTFPIIDEAAAIAARNARFAPRDLAYRAALGIGYDEPIPRSIGSVSTGAGRLHSSASGGRVRGRAGSSL